MNKHTHHNCKCNKHAENGFNVNDKFEPNTLAGIRVPDGNGKYFGCTVNAYQNKENGDIAIEIPEVISRNLSPEQILNIHLDGYNDLNTGEVVSVDKKIADMYKEASDATCPRYEEEEDPYNGYGYNSIPYDNADEFYEAQNDGYGMEVDIIRYPGDEFIDPKVLSARAVENDYNDALKYGGGAIRECNTRIVDTLNCLHKMEIATLLEYMTQQNLITMQTCLDMVEDAKNKK